MNSKRIQTESAIWDLHIHTCECPKSSSEFSRLDIEEYVEKIIHVFQNFPRLELFSFTDHNQISVDVYQKYIEKDGPVSFLVGVEQDVYFDEECEDYKHLVIYFDINKDNFSNNVSFFSAYNSQVKHQAIKIDTLLGFLINQNVKFVLSPHAFKQGKRGIEVGWNDEQTTTTEAKKYIDQFFVFWEYGGLSSRARAIEFLKDFALEEKISIISFSDSHDFKTLEEYLEYPTQEFLSLPSFAGLSLVGSDNSRIVRNMKESPKKKAGNIIGSIDFENNHIELSDRLNCIIGGRGSGKSVLLDSLAFALSDYIDLKDVNRANYIKSFKVTVYNYAGEIIDKNNFQFDYYQQSYSKDIFNSSDYYEQIKNEFFLEFNHIRDIDVESIKQSNKERFENNSYISIYNFENLENITGFVENYQVIKDESLELPLQKKNISKTKKIEYIQKPKFKEQIEKAVPKDLRLDSEIQDSISKLAEMIIEKTYSANMNLINTVSFKKHLIEKYYEYKDNTSDARKDKALVEKQFKDHFYKDTDIYKQRINTINRYITLSVGFKTHYENSIFKDGELSNAYEFKKVLDVEHPFEYLLDKFEDYFMAEVFKECADPLMAGILHYCFASHKKMKGKKEISDLDNELESLNIKYSESVQVLYRRNDEYLDLKTLSPGTQTNVLMEYLVHKETSNPLLIDQPEDNVDNQTIYNELRIWFKDLKKKRQVIVVTHDANITVNADAENIIIANQISSNSFSYTCGALEYNNNLETASNILDGGKEAVKRRMMKYGE